MTNAPSKLSRTQVDRLGERLRNADPTQDDLRMLDQYRRSFGDEYSFVVRSIRERTRLNPTGRPAKSTTAIREKLQRESIRLTQMQDIAGCRVVVEGISDQDFAVNDLCACFADVTVIDRRKAPSHGYRAVHVIVRHNDKQVEVQVRTRRQHQWAELSERLASEFDSSLKYGGGPVELVSFLSKLSEQIALLESLTQRHSGLMESPSFYFNDSFKIRPGTEDWNALLTVLASQADEMVQYISKIAGHR